MIGFRRLIPTAVKWLVHIANKSENEIQKSRNFEKMCTNPPKKNHKYLKGDEAQIKKIVIANQKFKKLSPKGREGGLWTPAPQALLLNPVKSPNFISKRLCCTMAFHIIYHIITKTIPTWIPYLYFVFIVIWWLHSDFINIVLSVWSNKRHPFQCWFRWWADIKHSWNWFLSIDYPCNYVCRAIYHLFSSIKYNMIELWSCLLWN